MYAPYALILNVDEPFGDGHMERMGATKFAPKIRKRYQTNELAVNSTEFVTRGLEVQILSPRPIVSRSDRGNCGHFVARTAVKSRHWPQLHCVKR